MEIVPNIITIKDHIYLCELFNKNKIIYNEINNLIKTQKNKKNIELLERIKNLHEDHMYFIISSLKCENYFDGDNYE